MLTCLHSLIHLPWPSSFVDANPLVQEEAFLINSSATLWTEGDDLASPDTFKRIFPFQFDLPSHLPPSFKAASARQIGDITYYIQLISVRSNTFKKTRCARKIFCVIPATTSKNVYYKSLLLDEWKHGLQSLKVENQIRRWPWEDYSHVQAEACAQIIVIIAQDLTIIYCSSSFPIFPRSPRALQSLSASSSQPKLGNSDVLQTRRPSSGRKTLFFPYLQLLLCRLTCISRTTPPSPPKVKYEPSEDV
jgi:hypothetical protein